MAERKEELKSLLMRVKEESWRKREKKKKAGLKLNIQKIKIMASSPITSQKINGEKVETVGLSWAPKSLQTIPAGIKLKGACSLDEKLWQT